MTDAERDRLSESLSYVLKSAIRGLTAMAERDPELRASLQTLAALVRSAAEPAPPASEAPPAGPTESPAPAPAAPQAADPDPGATPAGRRTGSPGDPLPAPPPEPAPAAERPRRPVSIRAMTPPLEPATPLDFSKLFKPHPLPPPRDSEIIRRVSAALGPEDEDLPLIERRLRLKAEGARWTAERRRREARHAAFVTEIAPTDRDIISRAKAIPNCYLWTNTPRWQPPHDLDLVDRLAGNFEALADAVHLCILVLEEADAGRTLPDALALLAEAQSALRVAITGVFDGKDKDSDDVFAWLRSQTSDRGIMVERHMRLNDPADPDAWRDRITRIGAVRSRLDGVRGREKGRRNLLGKVRWILKQIDAGDGDPAENWQVLARTVADLVDGGLRPSDRELRDLLLPAHERIPAMADTPRAFAQVLEEMDKFLATRPVTEEEAPEAPSDEVREVARLLEGRRLVLIGGEARPSAQRALIEAFGLADLDWLATREHESFQSCAPAIQRPDVALVILAIRWVSHGHGDVQHLCDEAGVPLVRLPAGYNPNQVAHQILKQCKARLAAR